MLHPITKAESNSFIKKTKFRNLDDDEFDIYFIDRLDIYLSILSIFLLSSAKNSSILKKIKTLTIDTGKKNRMKEKFLKAINARFIN